MSRNILKSAFHPVIYERKRDLITNKIATRNKPILTPLITRVLTAESEKETISPADRWVAAIP